MARSRPVKKKKTNTLPMYSTTGRQSRTAATPSGGRLSKRRPTTQAPTEADEFESFRESVRQERMGNRHEVRPTFTEITPEILEKVQQAANDAVEAIGHLRKMAELVRGEPDDIWWLQSGIVNAMNAGIYALDFLAGGARERLILAHSHSQSFSMARVSRGTAHDLASGIALEMACCAWNAICAAEKHPKRIGPSVLVTFRRAPVRIAETGVTSAWWPLFRQKHVRAVAKAVLAFPDVDADGLRSLILWEHVHVNANRDNPASLKRKVVDEEKDSIDAVEEALHGQQLHLYRFLRARNHWTNYRTLAERREFWRPTTRTSDATVDRALRRLQHNLAQIGLGTTLVIERTARRTKLDKPMPKQ